jgi:hypothetical protein
MQKKRKHFKFILIFVSAIILLLIPRPIGISWGQTATLDITQFPLIVSTRGHFNLETAELLPGHNKTDYTVSNIPGLQSGVCPDEIAIIVHGWGINQSKASERFVRANMSLEHNNYHNPVIGFSWDSNTTFQHVKAGWTIANLIAKENGPKLAEFILNFKDMCNNSKVRIIAHSLGSRVVLSTLDNLYNNQEWKNKNFTLMSVHLLGAAVDDEEVSKDPLYIVNNASIVNDTLQWYNVYGIKSAYGKIIESEVLKFYNLFNPKDTTLSTVYSSTEHDNALGLKGAQMNITLPSNYKETDVQNKIPPLCDADGDKIADWPLMKNKTVERGHNHAGYFGFINAANDKILIDDGAMNTVVRDWNTTLAPEKQDSTLSAICNTLY